ncbi:MAG: beta-Ala-His dipeptidase [Clostridia bacterium]|nr:beta-Ala-His dipeptidase [Clostridia bacterium]
MEKLDINKEEPKEMLKFFKEISEIPRKSRNEQKIRDYLLEFAKARNLEYYTDKYFNVIIRKNADKGFEDYEWLGLQAHTDMICEKEEWSNHNFEKDALELVKDGKFIKANGTTLGADNGVGVAFILAILDSNELKTPKLECIFTVQEETTMDGAKYIDIEQIKSRKIISLDNGNENKMVISSANCMEWFAKVKKEYMKVSNMKFYKLSYSNFKGGHSGGCIADKKRGNPIKLGIEILAKIGEVYISSIKGGSLVNVIPRNFEVEFACNKDIKEFVNLEIKKQKEFYGEEVKIEFLEIKNKEEVTSKETSLRIINFINSFNNGAISFDENGNQILSANFGAINEKDDYIRLEYSLRSNCMKLRAQYLNQLDNNLRRNDIEIIWNQELKGLEPDYKSNLVNKTANLYKKLFGKDMEKLITQGVLEGGFFKDRIDNLEYICIGANIFDAHSPDERVEIESLQRIWKFLKALVQEV